jgi:hypothetical protein
MIMISNYSQEHRDGKIYIHSGEESICPICGSKLQVIGSRQRHLIDRAGDRQTYVIRRLRCSECATIHHELPDLMVPYKRHCTDTIERAVTLESDSAANSNRYSCYASKRIGKWWGTLSTYFAGVIASLNFKYGCALSIMSRPREIIRAVVNTNKWAHTRSVEMSMLQ